LEVSQDILQHKQKCSSGNL